MRELSIFVDESGDFGIPKEQPAYYLVTLVFHDQKYSITNQVHKLEESIRTAGFHFEYIHTGPLIRREGIFTYLPIDDRRKLIYKMLNFTISCNITHETVAVDKKAIHSQAELTQKLTHKLSHIISTHKNFFLKYDKIIIYYDNGQIELSHILNSVFSMHLANIEFRKAQPQKYRLLQVADFICSLELLRIKWHEKRLSNSELHFFYKPKELQKSFFKSIDKIRIK